MKKITRVGIILQDDSDDMETYIKVVERALYLNPDDIVVFNFILIGIGNAGKLEESRVYLVDEFWKVLRNYEILLREISAKYESMPYVSKMFIPKPIRNAIEKFIKEKENE